MIFRDLFVGTEHNFREGGTADGTVQTTLWTQHTNLLTDEILVRIIYVTLLTVKKYFPKENKLYYTKTFRD